MQFLYPEFLWFGGVACLAATGLMAWAARRRRRDLDQAVAPRLRDALLASVSPVRRAAKSSLAILALAALSVALARPIRGYEEHEVKSRGIDVMVALDTSKSMDATDIAPSRLERAKLGIARFVDGLHGDRVGLVPFAGDAFVTCPQTLDHAAFLESLQELDTDTMPLGGTDLAAAIREAETALAESGGDQKVLLLITDGEALQGDALASAEQAAKAGITIHTIGVGTQQGELLRRADGGYVVDEAGQPVRSMLDERGLQAIAAAAGGRYEPLGRRAEGLLAIRDEVLSALPKSELGGRLRRTPIEAAELPLGIAVVALVLGFVLRESRRRVRHVAAGTSSARPRLAAAAALAVFAGGIALPAQESTPAQEPTAATDPRVAYNTARQLYADGEFAAARSSFESSLTSADPGVHALAYYGIGNALYRLGESVREEQPKSTVAQWEQSIEAYERALGLDPDDADAQFNRDFVARKLDELKQQLEQEEQQSEDEQQSEESPEQQSQDEQQGEDSQEQQSQDEQQGEESPEQQSQDGQQGEESPEQQSQDGQQGEESQAQQAQDGQQGEDSPEPQSQDEQQGEESPEQQSPEPQSQDEQQGEESQAQQSQDGQQGEDSQAQQPQEQQPVGAGPPRPDASEDRGEELPQGQPEPVQPVGEAGEQDPDHQVEGAVMTVRQAEHLLESLEEQEGRLRFMPARIRDRQQNNDRRDW